MIVGGPYSSSVGTSQWLKFLNFGTEAFSSETRDSRVKKRAYKREHNSIAEDDSGEDCSLNGSRILAPDPLLKKRGQAASLLIKKRT